MKSYIKINLKNIVYNYNFLKQNTSKKLLAVIKDNAYGHGLIKIGKTLSLLNPSYLVVSNIHDGIALRKAMIFSPILILGYTNDFPLAYSFKLTISIISLSHLKEAIDSSLALSIHLEFDVGMNRLGLLKEDIDDVLKLLSTSHLKLKGIYAHIYKSDTQMIYSLFKTIILRFDKYKNLLIHINASSTFFDDIDYVNAKRVGLMLYGYGNTNLKPALELYIPIIRIKKVYKDEDVSYEGNHNVTKEGFIYTIPFGYYHGLNKLKKLTLTYNDIRLVQIGKSCMDLTMLYSNKSIDKNIYINFFKKENIDYLLKKEDINIYYLLSSLNPLIERIYY